MKTTKNPMYICDTPSISEYPTLLKVWEESVRATHTFLKEADIVFYKTIIIQQNMFAQTTLTVVRNENQDILGFIGVSGTELDMIFILPAWISKGVGKMLMQQVASTQKINKVDVNEHNSVAIRFYQHFGFMVTGRSETDGLGKPYPVLHMER